MGDMSNKEVSACVCALPLAVRSAVSGCRIRGGWPQPDVAGGLGRPAGRCTGEFV